MRYVQLERITQDAKGIPDGEIFTVWTKGKDPGPFSITKETPDFWAFAFKMKGEVTLSMFKPDNIDAAEVQRSRKQILFAKRYGWSYTGKQVMDEDGEKVRQYHCLYCGSTTTEAEYPCSCRGLAVPKQKPLLDFLD